jgi:hypothetical protein
MDKLVSIACVMLGIYILGIFIVSLAGHPPSNSSMWILPLSLFVSVLLFYVAIKLWKGE